MKTRCSWANGNDEAMRKYHDEEWGRPVHEDKKLFEFIILESFQAGLSWKTILHKRAGFKKAFKDFDAKKIAKFTEQDVEKLMLDDGIIKNRLKIKSAISNAQIFLKLQKEQGSFAKYIWQFVDGKPIKNRHQNMASVPVTTLHSDAMAKDLKKLGFKFMGSTTCYAYMQAVGMVNDHIVDCCCYEN